MSKYKKLNSLTPHGGVNNGTNIFNAISFSNCVINALAMQRHENIIMLKSGNCAKMTADSGFVNKKDCHMPTFLLLEIIEKVLVVSKQIMGAYVD